MNTDFLIGDLVRNYSPLGRNALQWRLVRAAAIGFLMSAAGVALWMGLGADAPSLILFKTAYAGSIAIVAGYAAFALLRPEGQGRRRLVWLALPVLAIAGSSAIELVSASRSEWSALLFGQSAAACLRRIALLAAPIMAALFWSARAFAPKAPRLAGGAIGLLAGALAAALYALHCMETSSSFVAIWYSAGILTAGLTGLLAGSRILRW